VALVDAPDQPPRYGVWQEPEVATAGAWDLTAEDAVGRHRRLDERRARDGMKGEARRFGHAVVIVRDGIDARAVAMPFRGQGIESPQVARTDRKARGAVAEHGVTRDILEEVLGPAYVRAESRDVLLIGAHMRVAVAGNLVTARGNPPDQRRMALGDP